MRYFFPVLLLLLVEADPLGAQPSRQLRLVVTDTTREAVEQVMDWPEGKYTDTVALRQMLHNWLDELREAAYWEASIDTLLYTDSVATAFLHRGPRYAWTDLATGNVPSRWLARAGYRAGRFRRTLQPAVWERLRARILWVAGNAGYPFATLRLDSLYWCRPGQLSATMQLDKGPLLQLTRIELPAEAGISQRFLQNYLDVHPGQPYHYQRIEAVANRIRELPYLELSTEPVVTFVGEEVTLDLPVIRRRASRFDFIIGVLPNSNQTGKLLITGQLDAELQNSLGRGEVLAVQFEQLRPMTQQLNVALAYPYLLNLPFGVDLQFDLYRRDTNYVNLEQEIGLRYLLDGQRSVKVFYNWQRTNLLSVDSVALTRVGSLPDTLDVSRSSVGLAYEMTRLDYRNNPRKGIALAARASAGSKRIRRNNRILGLGLETLYDSLTLRTAQYRLEAQGSLYLPLGRSATVLSRLRTGIILSPEAILANEQFRIGGNRLLRGFDEESIFATNYAVGTVEARYLLGEDSYVYVFGDIGRIDSASQGNVDAATTVDVPLGMGGGISFATPAGQFGVSLAFGRRSGFPLDLGKPRVHLGYISRF